MRFARRHRICSAADACWPDRPPPSRPSCRRSNEALFVRSLGQQFHRLTPYRGEGIVLSDLTGDVAQAPGGIEAPGSRCAHQVTQRMQGVEQVPSSCCPGRRVAGPCLNWTTRASRARTPRTLQEPGWLQESGSAWICPLASLRDRPLTTPQNEAMNPNKRIVFAKISDSVNSRSDRDPLAKRGATIPGKGGSSRGINSLVCRTRHRAAVMVRGRWACDCCVAGPGTGHVSHQAGDLCHPGPAARHHRSVGSSSATGCRSDGASAC